MTDDDASPLTPDLPADVIESRLARRQAFAFHMAACNNQAKAARLAGFSQHPGTSKTIGSRLMDEPEVVALVEEERAARADRLRVDDQRIIDAYAALAFGDPRSVVSWDENGVGTVTKSDDLSDDEAMLVQGVEVKEVTDKQGAVTRTTTVKLSSRQAALDALTRIRGMNRDKVEVDLAGGLAEQLEEMRRKRLERDGSRALMVPATVVSLNDPPAVPRPGRAGRFLQPLKGEGDAA